jgi:hypothetical protein
MLSEGNSTGALHKEFFVDRFDLVPLFCVDFFFDRIISSRKDAMCFGFRLCVLLEAKTW